jgi:lipoprotein-anchoring transpeptidase ErfK/SrfK
MTHPARSVAAPLILVAACGFGDETPMDRSETTEAAEVPQDPAGAADRPESAGVVTALASGPAELSPEEIEAGRMDSAWKSYVDFDPDTTASGADAAAAASGTDTTAAETWDDISAESVNAAVSRLPVHGDVEGPAVAKIQILLDQARFSPGIIDGRWGMNTEKAVYWFQRAAGLAATGKVDQATIDALARRSSGPQVRLHTLTDGDVSGPYESLPEDVYARAEQPCLCYESRSEQLGEAFHTTVAMLERLNPGVDLEAVRPGQDLNVPAVDPFHTEALPDGEYTGGQEVARVVISDGGHYVHALDANGGILYHFPSTLGSDYAPSPDGRFSVESITFDPTWHYQPDLLSGVDPSREDAVLPAGPNNAVGIVWMQLSKPHYGIHGTSAPETIGYVTSHGCVRLTNWDAAFLARRIPPGVDVEFRDVANR